MKEEFLKICVGLLIIILIFITIQYFKILKSDNEEPNSQTENNLNNGDIILHTKVDNNSKKINNNLNKLSKNIEKVIINRYQLRENFSEPTKCGMDTSNIFYLHLTNKQLEERYKPEPFWKNRLFCVYKTSRLLSLNDSVGLENPTDEDYYYSLGDVILFKDYGKYVSSYQTELQKYKLKNQQCSSGENSEEIPDSGENSNESAPPAIEPFQDALPAADSNITNYNQNGLIGLKILIKNGRKPIGFEPNPVCTIKKSNGENLFVWKPIAPEGYEFLGHYCTKGINGTKPLIDSCKIRCIPKECLYISEKEPELLISDDIKYPYTIKFTSDGKYFKGMMSINSEEKMDNYELSVDCLNIERERIDLERSITLKLNLTNGKGAAPPKDQEEYELNSFKNDVYSIILKKMIQEADLKLNNFLNNKEIDFKPFQQDDNTFLKNMRLKIEVDSFEKNQFTVKITIRKRPIAYDELTSVILAQKLKEKYKTLFKIDLTLGGNKFNFEPDEYKILTGSELKDNIDHYNQLLDLLILKNKELENGISISTLDDPKKNEVRQLVQNINEIIELLRADITANTDTGKDFAISSSLTNEIKDTNTKITDMKTSINNSEIKVLINEIDSVILSILNKDLVPGKKEPTTAEGLNQNLVEKAEKAVREALYLNSGIELDIKKSIKTQELGRLPKY